MVAVFALAVILDLTRGGVLITAWSIMNELIIEVYEYLF